MGLGTIKRVRPGDYVSADHWNSLIDALTGLMGGTGQSTVRTPTGRHDSITATASDEILDFVVVRRIDAPSGRVLVVERAVRLAGTSGRWIGRFERDRTADPPPVPPLTEADQEAYLEPMWTWPGRTAGEYENARWPFTDEPGGWGDTEIDETDIMLAVRVAGDWIVTDKVREFQTVVSEAVIARDCVPEGA